MPPLDDPVVAKLAPSGPNLTVYDEERGITYLRMLDGDAEGADWREVSRIVLGIDPEREPGCWGGVRDLTPLVRGESRGCCADRRPDPHAVSQSVTGLMQKGLARNHKANLY